mgnify:CR=1 FL=1
MYNNDEIVSTAGEPTVYMNTSPKIGNSYSATYDYDGQMGEIRLSKTNRSEAWVDTEYHNFSSASTFYSIAPYQQEDGSAYVISFSPIDGSVSVNPTDNFSITFNEEVDVGTGDITIKLLSDDTTVEAIDVTSGQVTGSGTTTLTINPSSDLSPDTEYYVTIDATAVDSTSSGVSFPGFTDNGTWNFSTGLAGNTWWNGNWAYRSKITIDADKVNGDLSNFSIYMDLSDMPAHFFTNVDANGADLRVTKTQSREVAIELVEIDTVNGTGELYFQANGTLSSSDDTDFYIYYGNNGASLYANGDTYGSDNVWDDNYVGVWHLNDDPSGTVYDSTVNNYDASTSGSMNSADLLSISGGLGRSYDFDGSDDYLAMPNFSGEFGNNGTFSIWMKQNSETPGSYPGLSYMGSSTSTDLYGQSSGNEYYYSVFKNDRPNSGSVLTPYNISEWHYLTHVQNPSAYKIYYNNENL